MSVIELRSDTFTKPPKSMREAMASAPVGDDVYGEDPTVVELEQLAADMLGKEAACLMPSGTMANLVALLVHVPRGGAALVGAESDIYLYEAAGASVCGGIGYQPIPNQTDGTLAIADIASALPEDPDDPQFALPRVVCLEDTQNRCGGVTLPDGYVASVKNLAHRNNIAVHLDGARIFNAAVASGRPAAELAADADSVQFCLSKGLRAPVGSMLAGSADFVRDARRIRKMLGGGMRQAGVIAAAGIVALTQMVDRLAEDHALAAKLAVGLASTDHVVVEPAVQTNIVLFRLRSQQRTPAEFVAAAASAGVAVAEFGHGRIRAVVHADVTERDIDNAVATLADVLRDHRIVGV
jgi:threonine aldolase